MMISKKVVVIGAGAAGLMAGATAALYGASVTIIEKNKRVGRKIMITGKGRCNLANNCDVQTFINNVPVIQASSAPGTENFRTVPVLRLIT